MRGCAKFLLNNTDIFINHLITQERFKQSTVNNYRSFVKEYEPFMDSNQNDVKIATRKYLLWLIEEQKNSNNTINNKISMLKKYTKYLAMNNIIDSNQLVVLDRIKYRNETRIPKFYSYSILKRIYLIIVNAKNFTNEERLYIFFILNHATTFNELLSIDFTNINWKNRTLYIKTSERERLLYLQSQDLLFLTKFILEQRGNIDLKQSFRLFQYQGQPKSNKNIIQALRKLSVYLGMEIKFTTLRNTFIMYLIDIGVDIIYIKQYLGLKSFSSISRFEYINHTYLDETRRIINKLRFDSEISTVKNNVIQNIFKSEYQQIKLTYNNLYKIENTD